MNASLIPPSVDRATAIRDNLVVEFVNRDVADDPRVLQDEPVNTCASGPNVDHELLFDS